MNEEEKEYIAMLVRHPILFSAQKILLNDIDSTGAILHYIRVLNSENTKLRTEVSSLRTNVSNLASLIVDKL